MSEVIVLSDQQLAEPLRNDVMWINEHLRQALKRGLRVSIQTVPDSLMQTYMQSFGSNIPRPLSEASELKVTSITRYHTESF